MHCHFGEILRVPAISGRRRCSNYWQPLCDKTEIFANKNESFVKKIALYAGVPLVLMGLVILGAHFRWKWTTPKSLSVYVLDKTVPSSDYFEHKSFFWVMNHLRFVNPQSDKAANPEQDYYGFFPKDSDERLFEIRSIGIDAIEATAESYDMCYYADTYGVYYNEWYQGGDQAPERSGRVYGGLNSNDYLLLKAFKKRKKLILAEFNLYNAPTDNLVRSKVEKLLGLNWSGWTGKYFTTLDTTQHNRIPHWIVNKYKEQNQGIWNFNGSGIVLIHKYGKILVLNYPKGTGTPQLKTQKQQAERWDVPTSIDFTRWFDISAVSDSTHEVLAYFELPEAQNDSILLPMGVDCKFPAIVHQREKYPFYYFAGDFAEMQLPYWSSEISGATLLHRLFGGSTKQFMWDYYYPMMEHILKQEKE